MSSRIGRFNGSKHYLSADDSINYWIYSSLMTSCPQMLHRLRQQPFFGYERSLLMRGSEIDASELCVLEERGSEKAVW